MSNRRYTRDQINAIIRNRNDAVDRGIVILYDLQTADEKDSRSTRHRNGRGFNAGDAKEGTRFAKWVLSGRSLSGWHLEKARAMCLKYSGQLTRRANKETV